MRRAERRATSGSTSGKRRTISRSSSSKPGQLETLKFKIVNHLVAIAIVLVVN